MNHPRSGFAAPPQGGDAGGPAKPDPRRPLGCDRWTRRSGSCASRPGRLALACVAALLGACAANPQAPGSAGAAGGPAQQPIVMVAQPHAGLDRSGFDPAVRPQDDLFRAANGRWLKESPIPPDKADHGLFIQLRDRSDERVRKIVEELAAGSQAPGSDAQKIGDYYRSYLDEAAIESAGLAPPAPWLAEIDGLKDKAGLAALMGRLQGVVPMPLAMWIDADAKDPGIYRAVTWQDGLGLPNRDYYQKREERFAKAREAYLRYLESLLSLGGSADAQRQAKVVFALEERLARVQWSPVDNRNPVKTYNPMTPAALKRAAPGFDWTGFLKAAMLADVDRLTVSQPSYVRGFSALVQSTSLAAWKQYLRVRLLDARAEVLPEAFRDAHFAFHGQAIRGQQQDRPRWQKATASLDGALGEAVGRIYVSRHFPPAHKARMQELVANLLAAYGESIDGLTWMSDTTKQRARQKLSKYVAKIGYPDQWRDYSRLDVRPGDAFGNVTRAGRFEYERTAARAGKPVDRGEWGMTPQKVNAYYNPSFNEIVFPAAILEPPFFDMGADDAVNYGAIGAIIGHEISHGFDDQGSQYDGDGRLNNWWTAADRKAFEALGAKLVAQYGAYEPLPGHKVNGRLTLGENIADLSGLQIAFKAYQISQRGKPVPVIDGLTGDQRFFLGWAQAWRSQRREARTLQLLTIDSHSPAEFRANGAAVNTDGFHQSFGTQPGDGMYKPGETRIRIW
jgi:putative endopeptidase